ncbi:MAG: hypothetical protein GQ539_11970 [Sulfitobacter sp.]|nr:hypothetical protein [Sulfitobacter sp.]
MAERTPKPLGANRVIRLFINVFGEKYSGIFTPTESAAVGTSGAFLLALERGHMRKHRELVGVFDETARYYFKNLT